MFGFATYPISFNHQEDKANLISTTEKRRTTLLRGYVAKAVGKSRSATSGGAGTISTTQ